ncbi:hypothetical protein D9M71_538870 [compost metagenome]
MASAYSEPENTDKKLYIEMQYGVHSFGDLFEKIREHFGADVTLNQFEIETDYLQVRGCSCCNDRSDWCQYFTVTLLDKPAENTSVVPLATLIIED